MTALITGASGFVAQHLIELLTSQGENIIKTSLESEKKDDTSVALDVLNFDNCLDAINEHAPDVIYHLAGIAAPRVCENDFKLALDVNVRGVYNILKASEISEKKIRVIIISSSECYGKVSKDLMPIKEGMVCSPANNYGLSKLMAENVAKKFMSYSKNKNLECVIARPFNHIGPKQRLGFVVPDFCAQVAKVAKGIQEPVISVGNLEAMRDFTDVRDIVKGYYLLSKQGSGVYNLCSGEPRKIQEILDILLTFTDMKIEVKRDESKMRPSDVPLFIGDNSKIKSELGWENKIPFSQSIKDAYEYIFNNIELYK
ncbi:MAG: GDP-mannose 4,6-dehydratase [Bdellovibrionota bacterium]